MPVGMGGPGQEVQKGEMMAAGRGAREGGTVKRWAGDAARASRQEEVVGGQSQVPAGMAGHVELCGGPGAEVPDLHPLLSREPGGHPPCLFTAGPRGCPGHRKRLLCTHRKLRTKTSAGPMTIAKTATPKLKRTLYSIKNQLSLHLKVCP